MPKIFATKANFDRAVKMRRAGHTLQDIADALGCSRDTIDRMLRNGPRTPRIPILDDPEPPEAGAVADGLQ